jgi:hypothetical protein
LGNDWMHWYQPMLWMMSMLLLQRVSRLVFLKWWYYEHFLRGDYFNLYEKKMFSPPFFLLTYQCKCLWCRKVIVWAIYFGQIRLNVITGTNNIGVHCPCNIGWVVRNGWREPTIIY